MPALPPTPHTSVSARVGPQFHTTRWTRVCLAKADSLAGREALGDLCEAYYEPVVAFLRWELRQAEVAREMAHAFFETVLSGGAIHKADPSRGRFRSYLLGAVKHFFSHQRAASLRLKRGAGREDLPLEVAEVQRLADGGQRSPDAAFDRQWAITVLARALETLRQECQAQGRGAFFEAVKPLLTGEADHGEQAALAGLSGMNLAAFRMAAHRMKKRLRECVKGEVAGTLEDPALVAEEMQTLYAALGGG